MDINLMLFSHDISSDYDELENPPLPIDQKIISRIIGKYFSQTKLQPYMCKMVGVNTVEEADTLYESLTQNQKDSFGYFKAMKSMVDESHENVYNQIELDWQIGELHKVYPFVMIFRKN